MMDCPVLTRVQGFLGKCPGLENGVMVGISGGADSICLTHALWMLGNQGLFPKLIMAHVNHGLRGAESDADEVFVREFCQALGSGGNVEVRSLFHKQSPGSLEKGNLERNARNARYDFFDQMALSEKVAWVFTAHNRDDQIETVWMRLLRGASLRGLAGIPAKRNTPAKIRIGRPLLKIPRKKILQYLRENSLSWREDATNAQAYFLRNRLRHRVLPELRKQFQDRADLGILRLAGSARKAAFLEANLVETTLPSLEKPRVGAKVVLSLEPMQKLPMVLRLGILLHIWRREGWPTDAINSQRWREISKNMLKTGWKANLPGGVFLEATSFTIVIGPEPNR